VTVELRERIRALPGMDRLLPALEGLPPAYLVGGAVRDLLMGTATTDIDIAVEGDARATARTLAERLRGTVVEHEAFGTATLELDNRRVDFARTRTEVYPLAGALPLVKPASLAEDLHRRDFSINAMATALKGDELGRLHDPEGGREDLDRGVIRVLHAGSFLDDPTRLLRAVRYGARFDFPLEKETDELAREAIRIGAPSTVSDHRIRDELVLMFAEVEAPRAIERMHELELDKALNPALEPDAELAASAALGAVEVGADRVWSVFAALVCAAPVELIEWLDELGLTRDARERVARAARDAPALAEGLRAVTLSASAIHALLHDEPPEALALALALGAPPGPIMAWATSLRHVRLDITGDDLVAAGIEPGPALGRALAETLRAKLDGEVSGRDEELKLALELAR
jgi:tRNA nucleotidyltransferase (CCA-adding enzyme)